MDHLIELKSDAAVRRATGANEVVRQFRRVAFLVGLETAQTGDLRFLSINGPAGFDTEPFRAAVPEGPGSRPRWNE